MPQSAYFGGHGSEVMADMKKRYGDRAENVFYATANARGQKPTGENSSSSSSSSSAAAHKRPKFGSAINPGRKT